MTIEERIQQLVNKYVRTTQKKGDSLYSKELEGDIDFYECIQKAGYKYITYDENGKEIFTKWKKAF